MKTNVGIDLMFLQKAKVSLFRHEDKVILSVFILSLISSIMAGIIYIEMNDLSLLNLAIFLSIPFVITGVASCVFRKRIVYLMLVILATAALYMGGVRNLWATVLVIIFVGIIGVVAIVSLEQRAIFYPVISSVEYLNIKEKLSLWDKAVAFMFNISGDLDTRNLNIDYNMRRASIPWSEVITTLKLSILIGMFIWIYLCMNPTWMGFDSLSSVPVYLFSLILYIPVLVMPFSIFMSMNVRIETKYKDFRLYDGIKETLKRMAVPIFAAFMFILIAVNENGFEDVFYFILISVFFIMFINVVSCIMYYRYFESEIVEDIVTKWKEFRPIPMMISIADKQKYRKKEPATPKRDMNSFGELELNDHSKPEF